MLVAVTLAVASAAVAGEPRNFGRGIERQGDELVVEDNTGTTRIDVAGWTPMVDESADRIVLERPTAEGSEVRIVDRRGTPLGTIAVPPDWSPILGDRGVVLAPLSLHAPIVPHVLRFLSLAGDLRREVRDDDLRLVDRRSAPGGWLVAVSQPAAGGDWIVLVYDADGNERWRESVAGDAPPEALPSVDGSRLVTASREFGTHRSTVTMRSAGRGPKTVDLPIVARLEGSPTSTKVAAAGVGFVAVLDGGMRRLLWRRDQPGELFLQGGVRFDRRGERLVVVAADLDRQAGKAALALWTYRLSDGAAERADLGTTAIDDVPVVVDVDRAAIGEQRVVMHDRTITAGPAR